MRADVLVNLHCIDIELIFGIGKFTIYFQSLLAKKGRKTFMQLVRQVCRFAFGNICSRHRRVTELPTAAAAEASAAPLKKSRRSSILLLTASITQ